MHYWNHARTRSSAALARTRWRCAARWRCRTTPPRRSRSMRNGQAVEVEFPVPPGVVGHDPALQAAPIKYDPAGAQRAARPLRLQEGRRRLADAARRQAVHDPSTRRVPIRSAASRTSCGRSRSTRIGDPDGSAEGQVSRAAEARAPVQADDAHGLVDRRLSGRRQLHAAAVRQEHRPEQQCLRGDSRVRQARTSNRSGCRTRRSATSSTTRWRS